MQDLAKIYEDVQGASATNTIREIKRHLPRPVTAAMRKAAQEIMPGYLFLTCKNAAGVRRAHCTKCGRDFEIWEKPKHNTMTRCPKCKKEVRSKDEWRGYTTLADEFDLTYYYPSRKEVGVMLGVCATFWISYRGDWRTARMELRVNEIYLLRQGTGGVRVRCGYYSGWCELRKCKSYTRSAWNRDYRGAHHDGVSLASAIEQAGLTRTGASETVQMTRDKIKALDFTLKYPSVEYLLKMGQRGLIRDYLQDGCSYGAVHWQGRTAQAVLRLSGQELREIKKKGIALDAGTLRLMQLVKKAGAKMSVEECAAAAQASYYELANVFRYAFKLKENPITLIKYFEKQSGISHDYADYLMQCEDLDMDLSDRAIRFPKDFRKMHGELSARIKHKADEVLNAKIEKWAAKLGRYKFEYGGVMMRPANSSGELIAEGNALKHCVGGYVKQYAEARTILCVIRRVEAPETPWHTAEFRKKDGTLVQCRGYTNRTAEADKDVIAAFLAAFAEHLKAKKARETA